MNPKKKIIILCLSIGFYSFFFNKRGYSHAKYDGRNIGTLSTHNFYTNKSATTCAQSFEKEIGKQLEEKSDDSDRCSSNGETLRQRRNLYIFLVKVDTYIHRPYYSPLQGLSVPLPNKEITTRDTISFAKVQFYFTQNKGADGKFYTSDDWYKAKPNNVLNIYNTEQNGHRISNINSNAFSAMGINGKDYFRIDVIFLVSRPSIGIYGSISKAINLSFVFDTTGESGGIGEEEIQSPISLTIDKTQLEVHTKSNELIRPLPLR